MSLLIIFCYIFEDYEVKRHIEILESGGVVEQETRSFDKRKKYDVYIQYFNHSLSIVVVNSKD